MSRKILVPVLALVAAAIGSLGFAAQELVLYGGDLKSVPVPITVGPWGSGTLTESSEIRLQNVGSLKLVSQGGFQGGRIDFAAPLDLSTYASQRNAFIEIDVRPFFGPQQAAPPTPAVRRPAARPGTAPRPGATARPGTTRPGTTRPGTTPRTVPYRGRYGTPSTAPSTTPTYGGAYGNVPRERPSTPTLGAPGIYNPRLTRRPGAGAATTAPPASGATGATGTAPRTSPYRPRNIRPTAPTPAPTAAAPTPVPVVPEGPAGAEEAALRTDGFRIGLVTDRGIAVLTDYPIYPGARTPAGWVKIGFPLADFQGPIGDKLQRIIISSHRADTVYIGQIKLRLETSAIQARPVAQPAITRVGEPVTFLANASAGLMPLKVAWDFPTPEGASAERLEGPRVVNVFDQPGSYEVTATISNATGADMEQRVYHLLVTVK